jgi:hypothetical protein
MWNTLLYICSVLRWFAHYSPITMTALYAFSILFIFIARFTCSNGLVCCVRDNVGGGGKAGFYVREGYWEGVTVNHSSTK